MGSAVELAGIERAAKAGCRAAETPCSADVMEVCVTWAAAICGAVGALVGTMPRTRCVTSDVSGFRLAARLTAPPTAIGARTDDSVAGEPSTSLNGAVSTNGGVPLVTSEYFPA